MSQSRIARKFSLLDAMILVAVTALGLGLTRRFFDQRFLLPFDPIGPMSPRWGSPWNAFDWATWAAHTARSRFYYLLPVLITCTVTALALCMRHPRPRVVRLVRQPGVVAVMTAASALVLSSPLLMRWNSTTHPLEFLLTTIVSYAVASSWLVLLVGGRWLRNSGWIDRIGRFVGLAWISPIIINICFILLDIFN